MVELRGLLLLVGACSSASVVRDPSLTNAAEPDPVIGMSGFAYFFTCALHRSGTVNCDSIFDLKPPADVVELDGDCLRTRDGRVLCTNGAEPFQEIAGVRDATRVASSYATSCAIRRDRSVVCWGKSGDAFAITAVSHVRDLAIDGEGCAVDDAGGVACWSGRDAARPIHGLPPVAQLVMFTATKCARLYDGTVACWGSNRYGERGDADPEASERPRIVAGVDRVTQLVASAESVCALRDDGGVWCWGGRSWSHHGERPRARKCTRPHHVSKLPAATRIWMTTDTLCTIDAVGHRSCLSDEKREAALYHAPFPSHWLDGCE